MSGSTQTPGGGTRPDTGPPGITPDAPHTALPFVLSLLAGATDTIGFLLFGLFTAHVTGNLVVLAAHLVTGNPAVLSYLLSVPVFMVALLIASILGSLLGRRARGALAPLLGLQLLLLIGTTVMCLAQGAGFKGGSAPSTTAALLAVAAMAVQSSLVQISLTAVPSTAVMTTNVVRLVRAVGEMLTSPEGDGLREARRQARRLLPVVLGFLLGCVIGAVAHAAVGVRSLLLPIVLALLALLMGRPRRAKA